MFVQGLVSSGYYRCVELKRKLFLPINKHRFFAGFSVPSVGHFGFIYSQQYILSEYDAGFSKNFSVNNCKRVND